MRRPISWSRSTDRHCRTSTFPLTHPRFSLRWAQRISMSRMAVWRCSQRGRPPANRRKYMSTIKSAAVSVCRRAVFPSTPGTIVCTTGWSLARLPRDRRMLRMHRRKTDNEHFELEARMQGKHSKKIAQIAAPALVLALTVSLDARLAAQGPAGTAPAAAEQVRVVDLPQRGEPPTGPHAVVIEHDQRLATHTIYRPATLGPSKHSVLVWGEGGCAKNGLTFPEYLSEIASHGFVVMADGPPIMPAARGQGGGGAAGPPRGQAAGGGAPRGQAP